MTNMLFNPYSKKQITALFRKAAFRPQKKLGQNFLISESAAQSIIRTAGLTSYDTVIEIGSGLLSLTLPLSSIAKQIFAFEKDSKIMQMLRNNCESPSNVTFINKDFLKFDIREIKEKISGKIKVLGNLPYSTSSQILIKLLHSTRGLSEATLAFQKELAERIVSLPGAKTYGSLSVLSSLLSKIEPGPVLGPELFYPSPRITSRILKIKFLEKPLIHLHEIDDVSLFARTLFQYRRKKLSNTLKNACRLCPEETGFILKKVNISPNVRLETLSPQEILKLYRQISKIDS